MFVLGRFVGMLALLLQFGFNALMLILLANAILSWVRPAPNPIVNFLEVVSNAVCNPIRRLFPTVFGGLDIAPLIAILVIQFVGLGFVVTVLQDVAARL